MVAGSGFAVPTNSISDTAGLTWINRVSGGCHYADFKVGCEYYAISSGTLSGDKVTFTFGGGCGGGCSNFEFVIIAISGANTASPFDPNGAEPVDNLNVAGASGKASCTMSTGNPYDMLVSLNGWNYQTSIMVPSGWNQIDITGGANPTVVDAYQIIASTLSGQGYTWTGIPNGYYTLICDAVRGTPSISLGSSLSVQAVLSATEATALSLTQIINQQVADTASGSLGLAASIGQDAGGAISDLSSLSSSLNQDLGLTSPAAISLTSSIMASGLSAVLNAAATLSPGISQDLGNGLASALSLVSAIGQDIGVSAMAAVSTVPNLIASDIGVVLNTTSNLSATLNQDLSGIVSSVSEALVSSLSKDVGSAISADVSLVSTISQDLGVQVSGSVSLLANLLIEEFVAALNLVVNLASTVNPGAGVGVSAAVSLISSLGNNVAYRALFTIAETIRPFLSQGIGGLGTLLSVAVKLTSSTLTSLSIQLSTVLTATPVLNLALQVAIAGTVILTSVVGSVYSSLTTTSSSSTTTPGVPGWTFVVPPIIWLLLVLLLFLAILVILATRRRKKEDEEQPVAQSLVS
jgi:uncharacterized membrane protein